MRRIYIAILTLGLVGEAWGQSDRSFEDFFDKFLKGFEKDMEQQMKRFEKMFQSAPFGEMEKMFPSRENVGVEPFWRETDNQRILVFKVDSSDKEIPFNIQIENGHITVEGTVKKQQKSVNPNTGATSFSSNVYQFQHGPVPIPSDVDEGGVKIEKKKDEVLIRFPKKIGKAKPAPPGKSGRPLPRHKGDKTI